MCNFLENIPVEIYAVLLGGTITIISLYIGFYLWKKQIKIQKQYEATLNFIEAIVKYHHAIKFVRHPFMSVHEESKNADGLKERPQLIAEAYQNRWVKILESRTILNDRQIIFELVTGLDMNKELEKLYEFQSELFMNLQIYLDRLHGNKELQYEHNVIYSYGKEKDEFDKKISIQINKLKQDVKPFLLK